MSVPVSTHHRPFTTNILASKKFLILYIFIIWSSIIPVILEIYFFWRLIEKCYFLLFFLFPIQIYFGYLILAASSIVVAKILLVVINFIHKPQQGIFERIKRDKNYYFYSLRAVVKKWPVWVSKFISLPFLDKLVFKWFHNDSEFIYLGKNVISGKESSIKASIILGNYLIIKKVEIKENVIIGSNSFITPGTQIGKNTVVGAMSITKYNQILKPFSIYVGIPAEKLGSSVTASHQLFEKIISITNHKNIKKNNLNKSKTQEGKFIKNFYYNLLIIAFIYFISYSIPIFVLVYYNYQFLIPYILKAPNFIYIFNNSLSLIILLVTPLIFILLYIINLSILIVLSKIVYNLILGKSPIKEGKYHWNYKSKDYSNYFIRSFYLRYVKWKLQRSPFPWLLRVGFNFIGNCNFGKNTVVEDSYIAKELLNVGNNTYLGKSLIENHLWDKFLTIKSINIKDNVVISDFCCIAPGTEIENNVNLLPLSVTAKNAQLNSNFLYFGAPLSKISKNQLINIMNFKL